MSAVIRFFSASSSCLAIAAGFSLGAACPAHASSSEVQFNEVFLRSPVDIRMFSRGNPVPAGTYRVDVQVNGGWKGRHNIPFELPSPQETVAQPCFDLKLLDGLGLDIDRLGADTRAALQDQPMCAPLGDIVPGAAATFDSGEQRLEVTAPQIAMLRRARGYVSPALWDDGITAGILQYDYLTYYNKNTHSSQSYSDTSHYLGLRAGANLGAWRLRYRSALNHTSRAGNSYQNIAAYAERGIAPWRSKLVLGDATTDGQVFDSLGFRGVQLSSEERMYADSLRGFAPIVQGIANSNARVQVSQQGNLIYETTVPPGPFMIDDLYPTGIGGDLHVTVIEADGSEHTFTVAYATTAELLRPGVTRYNVMAGQYRNRALHDKPSVFMGTVRHGFSNLVTGYTGLIGADGYRAVAAGVGLNTRFGAISMDVTHARTELGGGDNHEGQSLRLAYSKILPMIGTNVTLATYRYSSSGYYDPNEAFILRDGGFRNQAQYRDYTGRRNRMQVSATQALPDGWGSFSLNATRQDYWRRRGTDTEFQFQYNNHYKKLSYGVSAGRSRNIASGRWDNQVMLTLSVPLGTSAQAPYLNTGFSRDSQSHSLQTTLSGALGDANQVGYSIFANTVDYRHGSRSTTTGASGSWTAPFASLGASVSSGGGYRQYSTSVSGGVVAYSGGVVLSPALGETAALIEAKGAAGAQVANYNGVQLDSQGRALVPYLNPYRQNIVEIDPKGVSTDVELKETSRRLAPTVGAIALVRFDTETGHSVLLKAVDGAGQPLPFGATVLDEQGRNLGHVAQAGQALLRLPAEQGSMRVTWGDGSGQSCTVTYDIADAGQRHVSGYRELSSTCTKESGV